MSDITMCAQTNCPNASHCVRVQAKASRWQSMAAFEFTISPQGEVLCDDYVSVMQFTKEQAVRVANGTFWSSLSMKERAILGVYQERLCMPWSALHEAVENFVGHDVYTHQFANRKDIIAMLKANLEAGEFERLGEELSMRATSNE